MGARVSPSSGMAESVAVCPGTYDPVTNGHLDVIRRAATLFDRVIVAVVRHPRHKQTMFTLEDRIRFIQDSLERTSNITVEGFATLVVDFTRSRAAHAIVKGLRAVSDFEWEFQMNSFLSSRGVREIASFGGSVSDYVPEPVARRLIEMHAKGEI